MDELIQDSAATGETWSIFAKGQRGDLSYCDMTEHFTDFEKALNAAAERLVRRVKKAEELASREMEALRIQHRIESGV